MSDGRDDRVVDELAAELGLTVPADVGGATAGDARVPPQRTDSVSTSPSGDDKQAAIDLAAALRRRRDRSRTPGTASTGPLPALAAAVRRLRDLGRTDAVIRALCEEASAVCGLERVALTLPAPAGGWRVVHATGAGTTPPAGVVGTDAPDPSFVVRPGSAAALAVATGGPATADTPTAPARPACDGRRGGGPYVVVPVPGPGTPAGLLHAGHEPPRPVTDCEVTALAAFAEVVSPVWRGSAVAAHWEERVAAASGLLADVLTDAHVGRGDVLPAPAPVPADGDHHVDRRLPLETLTPREHDVLGHLLAGAANREIAAALVLSVETVKTHVKKVLRKLGAGSRAELVSRTYWDPPT